MIGYFFNETTFIFAYTRELQKDKLNNYLLPPNSTTTPIPNTIPKNKTVKYDSVNDVWVELFLPSYIESRIYLLSYLDVNSIPLYKMDVNGNVVKRTKLEIDSDYNSRPYKIIRGEAKEKACKNCLNLVREFNSTRTNIDIDVMKAAFINVYTYLIDGSPIRVRISIENIPNDGIIDTLKKDILDELSSHGF